MPREKQRHAARHKKKVAPPPVDTLTVVWMSTMATALICEVGAAAARLYVRFVDSHADLLHMFSGYLLLAGAVIGFLLILMTPVVVKRKKSNPPTAVVVAAYVVGALPWLAMMLQAWE